MELAESREDGTSGAVHVAPDPSAHRGLSSGGVRLAPDFRSPTNLRIKVLVNQLTRTQAEGTRGQENQGSEESTSMGIASVMCTLLSLSMMTCSTSIWR